MEPTTKTTTILEMHDPGDLRPKTLDRPGLRVERMAIPCPEFNKFLHTMVGQAHRWGGRRTWTRDDWIAYANRETLETWVATLDGTPAGYFEIEKEYRVDAKKPIPEALLESYVEGVKLEGETLKIREYRFKNPRSVSLVMVQGRNREIRRVFAHWHIALKRIHRTRIGIVRLQTLPPGQYRPLSRKEIDWFLRRADGRTAERW